MANHRFYMYQLSRTSTSETFGASPSPVCTLLGPLGTFTTLIRFSLLTSPDDLFRNCISAINHLICSHETHTPHP